MVARLTSTRQRFSRFASGHQGARLARFANRPGALGQIGPRDRKARLPSSRFSELAPTSATTGSSAGRRRGAFEPSSPCGCGVRAAFCLAHETCSPGYGRKLLRPAWQGASEHDDPRGRRARTVRYSAAKVRLRYQVSGCRTQPPGEVLPSTAALVAAWLGQLVSTVAEACLRCSRRLLRHQTTARCSKQTGPCGHGAWTACVTGSKSLLSRP